MMPQITPEAVALALIWYIVFLFSTTCHEAAHALAAKWGGDLTAFHGGQVTLNPLPHIQREPFGTVLVPILAYFFAGWMIGWASAPYDPHWQARHPRRAALMALAGPAANFLLMLLAALGIRIGLATGRFRMPTIDEFGNEAITVAAQPGNMGFLTSLLSVMFVLNLLLATFNLFPVPPLDGNSAITLLMPEKTALRFLDWTQNSGLSLLGLLVAWYVFGKVFVYVFALAFAVLYSV